MRESVVGGEMCDVKAMLKDDVRAVFIDDQNDAPPLNLAVARIRAWQNFWPAKSTSKARPPNYFGARQE